jgi:hypothetical protein
MKLHYDAATDSLYVDHASQRVNLHPSKVETIAAT